MDPPVWLGGPDSGGGQSWGPGGSWPVPPGSSLHGVGSTPHCSLPILPSLMGCGFLSLGHTMVWGCGGAVTLKPPWPRNHEGFSADPHPWTREYQEGCTLSELV